MTKDQRYARNMLAGVTDLERLEVAQDLLETAKEMQLQGWKRILGTTITNPMVTRDSKVYALDAYLLACAIQNHVTFIAKEKLLECKLTGCQPSKDPNCKQDAMGKQTPYASYILEMQGPLVNLQDRLDKAMLEIGIMTGDQVYRDMIAETTAPRKPSGGVFRDGRQHDVCTEEETQN